MDQRESKQNSNLWSVDLKANQYFVINQKQYPWEGENEHWIYLNVGQNKVR